MSDVEGTFRITYYNRDAKKNIVLDFGSITSISSSANKAVSTIPLVSMGADRAFQLETGNTLTYTISFKRKSPMEFDNTSSDSTQWSNAYWYIQVTKLIDRWQMRTDGCRMTYSPSLTNPYVPDINVNGYIKMLSRKYTNKFNELIEGTIQFVVGTMYVLSSSTNSVPEQEKYRTLILRANKDENTMKKYSLRDVIYAIPYGQTTITLPPTPPDWSMYTTAFADEVTYWKISVASSVKVGETMNVSSDIITLNALWLKG